MNTTLERVKIRLGIPADENKHDDLLSIQIEDAESFFKDYCNRLDIPESARGLIEQLVVVTRNSHGGVQSEKIGDTSTTYFEAVLSDELKKQLNRHRKIRVL